MFLFQTKYHIDGLVQDCSNSIANALELLQFCTKPLTCKVHPNNYTYYALLWFGTSFHNFHILNPLRAIFFRENINIYLHFMSFLHIDKTQVLKIIP